nr:hypothetical protein [Alteromonas ponticola]
MKKAAVGCRGAKEKDAFVRERLPRYPIKTMCYVFNIERCGFYAWLKQPSSAKAKDDNRLLGKSTQFWLESGCTYVYRNITIDLKSVGETCGKPVQISSTILKASTIQEETMVQMEDYLQ